MHFRTSKYFALRHKVGSSDGEVIQILTNVIGEQIFQRHGQCIGEHLQLQDKIAFGWVSNDYFGLVCNQLIHIHLVVSLCLGDDALQTSIRVKKIHLTNEKTKKKQTLIKWTV